MENLNTNCEDPRDQPTPSKLSACCTPWSSVEVVGHIHSTLVHPYSWHFHPSDEHIFPRGGYVLQCLLLQQGSRRRPQYVHAKIKRVAANSLHLACVSQKPCGSWKLLKQLQMEFRCFCLHLALHSSSLQNCKNPILELRPIREKLHFRWMVEAFDCWTTYRNDC